MFAYSWAESEDETDEHEQTTTLTWEDAACRDGQGALTLLFFSDAIPDIELAKAICSTCPLVEPCLRGALSRREPVGVWGGQLFADGVVIPRKRKRGRPPKVAAALPSEQILPAPTRPETVRRLERPQEQRKTA
jgi:WhiB family transcriptional regulator, redox-sensing transcriptional regulator